MEIAIIIAVCVGLALGAGGAVLALRRKKVRPRYSIETDPLTGAMSFEQFKTEAPKLLAGGGDKYALWYCDIKNFKHINDACGYAAGDKLLRAAYDLLSEELGSGELVCRVSADNFACLARYTAREEMSERFSAIAARLSEYRRGLALQMEIEFYGGFYPVDGGETGLNFEEMLDRANLAQESAKRQGGACCAMYSERMRSHLLEEQELEGAMAEALRTGQFTVYLQPIVDLTRGGLYAAEALARWIRPDGTRLTPDHFIPLFERNGFVVEVDAFVFEEVCRLQRQRLDGNQPTVPINVNLSKNSMFRSDFVARFCAIRDKYSLPANLVVLESTEAVAAESMDWYRAVLRRLREEGFLLALDNYGSGYASPALLKDALWDVVKLDPLFFRPGENRQQDEHLIRGLVRMCRSVGVDVIAEGVEEQSQIPFLQEIGCNAVQGYVFSRPVGVEEFDRVASRLSVETTLDGVATFLPPTGDQTDRQTMLQVMRDFWYHYWNVQTSGSGHRCALGEEMVFVGTALRDQVFGGRSLAEWLQQRRELSKDGLPFRLSDEWYRTMPLSTRAWLVYGGFSVSAQRAEDRELAADTYLRFTAILSWEDEVLTLQHLHVSVPDRLHQDGMYYPLAESARASDLLRGQLAAAETGRDKALRARVLVDEICHKLCACSDTQFLLVDMANGRLEYDGEALRHRFGIDPECLPGDASNDPQTHLLPLIHPDDRLRCLSIWAEAEDDKPFSFNLRLRGKTGAYIPLLVQVCPLEETGLLLAVVRDQDSVHHLQAESAQRPGMDGETGLWNRSGGRAAVDSYLSQPGGSGLLLIFQLTGEQVPAVRFAGLMRETFRGDDILIRLEENRFAAFLKRARPSENSNQMAEHLCQRFNLDAETSGVSCSISESFAPENSTGFDSLYDRANRSSARTPMANIPAAPAHWGTAVAAPMGANARAAANQTDPPEGAGTAQSPSLFGAPPTQAPQAAPLFGAPPTQAPQAAPLFGAPPTPAPQAAPLFGAPPTQAPQAAPPAAPTAPADPPPPPSPRKLF